MRFDWRDERAVGRRLRRAFVASAIVHAALLVWLALGGGAGDGPPVITEVTWLDPKDLEPKSSPVPKAPETAVPPVVATPKATPPVAKPTPPKPAPKPVPKVPEAKATVRDRAGESGVAPAPAPPRGERGRAEGARVAREVAQTAQNVDRLLSGIGGTLPAPASGGGAGGGRRNGDAFAVAGGRGAGGGPATEGALRGSGLGAVGAGGGAGGSGAGRGVQRTAVAIADDGVETGGDGAAASGRDSRSLMATVQRYVAGIKFCYDNSLKKTPGLSGKITLQMDIAASGAVTSVEPVDDSMGNAALARCILSQVQGWKFVAIPAGTVRFTLPLVFSPPQTAAGS
jgi:TonB family protein